MVRPFEKYPVNHHLAQMLERVVAVGAVRYGPVIGEFGVFNGDEPTSARARRRTFQPLRRFVGVANHAASARGAELSASLASVTSPEVRAGHGLDQRKGKRRRALQSRDDELVALRDARVGAHGRARSRRARHDDSQALLGEAAVCRARRHRRRRVSSEPTVRRKSRSLDPFRTPRPAVDLSNLGVSRWTTVTVSLSAPRGARRESHLGAAVRRGGANWRGAGTPPGSSTLNSRYGANRMWMLSAGVRSARRA